MKHLSLLPFLMVTPLLAHAQVPDLLLLPEWKEGQYRTYMVEREGGWPDGPQDITVDARLEVTGYNIVAYELDLSVSNFLIDQADWLEKGDRRDLEEFERSVVHVSVNKKTGEYQLSGAEEAGEVYADALKKLVRIRKEQDRDAANELEETWEPWAERMEEEEDALAWFTPLVDLLTLPLCRSFYLGDTLRNEVEARIPVAADSLMPAIVLRRSVLTGVDREADEATVVEVREHPVPPLPGEVPPDEAPEPEVQLEAEMDITYELREAWPKEGRLDLSVTPVEEQAEAYALRITVVQTGRSKK